MKFYTGIHHPHQVHKLDRAFVSVAALHRKGKWRKSDFQANDWIMDSAAFSDINLRGEFFLTPKQYAEAIDRWSSCGNLVAAFTQDLMCEKFILEKQTARQEAALLEEWAAELDCDLEAGDEIDPLLLREDCYELDQERLERVITVRDHQEAAIDRYLEIKDELDRIECRVPLLPVLQGFTIEEYLYSLQLWEDIGALPEGAYVGVGSICKRQGKPAEILAVLQAIKAARPDLRLHGFGVKLTSLKDERIVSLLESADSMAWSYSARKQGRDGNDIQEALTFAAKVEAASQNSKKISTATPATSTTPTRNQHHPMQDDITRPAPDTPEWWAEIRAGFTAPQRAPITREEIADARSNGLADDILAVKAEKRRRDARWQKLTKHIR